MPPDQPKPQWQPISRLNLVSSMIDGVWDNTNDQYRLFRQAAGRPGSMDDAIVKRARRLYQAQLEDMELYAEQCRRWSNSPLTDSQRKEVERLVTLIPRIKAQSQAILDLVDEIADNTIESLLSKSDLELGIEYFERRRQQTSPANNNERRAQQIDAWVLDIMKGGGTDEDILLGMYPHMAPFKKILDTASQSEIDRLCENYPGFYYFAQILEDLAGGIADGSIEVPQ